MKNWRVFVKIKAEWPDWYISSTHVFGFAAVKTAKRLAASGDYLEVAVISKANRQIWAWRRQEK